MWYLISFIKHFTALLSALVPCDKLLLATRLQILKIVEDLRNPFSVLHVLWTRTAWAQYFASCIKCGSTWKKRTCREKNCLIITFSKGCKPHSSLLRLFLNLGTKFTLDQVQLWYFLNVIFLVLGGSVELFYQFFSWAIH